MPLVHAVCVNCNANLQVDNSKEAAICPYCGAAYIVEKAINQYSITNQIKADVVNLQGTLNSGFDIRAGVLKKYTGSATDVIIPDGVIEIAANAFSNHHYLHSVIIPEGVKVIQGWAFSQCENLKKVQFPSTLTTIYPKAFYRTGLSSVTVPDGLEALCGFEHCHSLTEINVPSSAKIISFLGYNGFRDFHIPYGIQKIGPEAFWGWHKLDGITIPSSVTEIGDRAFADCTALKNIVIPSSVTKIGASAFGSCTSLKSIIIPPSVTAIGDSAFSYCTSLKKIVIPQSVTEISACAFQACTALEEINIPDSISKIGHHAFAECTSLSKVTMPYKKPQEGTDAFRNSSWGNKRQQRWQKERVCDICGGAFKGILEKTCKNCGTKKRY